MDKGYEKERFESLSIKSSVIHKFREFCKNNAASQSMTLLQMVQFFEFNGIAPTDNLGEPIAKLEGSLKKRINAVIAIIKNIEKHQTKPTNAMLLSLFEENLQQEEQELEEREFSDMKFEQVLTTENEELTYYRKEYFNNQEKHNSLKYDIKEIVRNTKYIKSNFGKNYLKLELTKKEYEKFKRALNEI